MSPSRGQPERIATTYSVADLHRLLHAGFRRRFHNVPLTRLVEAKSGRPGPVSSFRPMN